MSPPAESFLSALIIPFFNESNRINANFFKSILNLPVDFIILVDDGSSDGSSDIISQILGEDKRLIWLENTVNLGKSEAVRVGLIKSIQLDCKFILTSDADGALETADLQKALSLALEHSSVDSQGWTQNAIFSGARVRLSGWNIQRTTLRQWVGRIIATLVSIISGVEMYDPQSPVRVYVIDRKIFLRSLQKKFKTKWFSEIELILRLQKILIAEHSNFLKIYEFPLGYFKDVAGGSLTPSKILLVVKELITLKWVKHYSKI
jgi:glycosyltransferase involved in cell wall biosynthesis